MAPGQDEERCHILIDHTDDVRDVVARRDGCSDRRGRRPCVQRVDFVNDNVGMELLFDLALADFLLVQGWARRVVFHLKDRPFFVSDASPEDVQATISLLEATAEPAGQELGARIRGHVQTGWLILKEDPFWTSYLTFRHLTPALRAELACADLVILKGDVNYRRLLDDRHWPHTTRMEEIADYFPASFLVLRTLKGEIMVGLEAGQAEALTAEDPTWLINGKRGIIQLVTKPSGRRR
jgi:hypothetical protein